MGWGGVTHNLLLFCGLFICLFCHFCAIHPYLLCVFISSCSTCFFFSPLSFDFNFLFVRGARKTR